MKTLNLQQMETLKGGGFLSHSLHISKTQCRTVSSAEIVVGLIAACTEPWTLLMFFGGALDLPFC